MDFYQIVLSTKVIGVTLHAVVIVYEGLGWQGWSVLSARPTAGCEHGCEVTMWPLIGYKLKCIHYSLS